jgi:hypothetical protein
MKKSKYLGMVNGDWECTHVGVARVQPSLTRKRGDDGKRLRSKHPGSQQYYYIFERLTADETKMKMIRLNAAQALNVLNNVTTVEELAEKKARKVRPKFKDKISYSFCY